MASVLENPAIRQAALPISVEQYHELGRAGIIPENTELVRGIILGKMIKSPEHSWLVQYLADWLRSNLQTGWHVRQEQPLTLADSEPEPDLAVVKGSPSDYRQQHPSTAALVIEVAVTSSDLDREKAAIYAEAKVSEYWLLLPGLEQAEVFTQPAENGYAKHEATEIDGTLSPIAFPGLKLELRALFDAEQ